MEYYRSIKNRTNTPVRLVFYPGEAHGNRNAASRLDCAARILRWMNYYLGLNMRTAPKPDYDLKWEDKVKQD